MGNKLDNINENGYITFKAKFVTKIYPRDKNITEYEPFGIIKWQLLENIEGIVSSQFPLVTGKFYFEPNERIEYILQVKEVFHPKYGQQYEVISWREDIDFSKVSGQKTFLSTFLTENQIDNLYNLYDNPLKIISKHDIDSLIKVKGIKRVLAQKIIERFENSKTNAELYIKLGDLGLTTNFIDSLISRYKVAPVIIDKVRKHPYDLAKEMEGVGFTRADELAMKVGISAQSPERIKAYIEFVLDEKAQEGNSYVYAKELMTWIYDQFQGKENILKVYTDSEGNITGNNISMAIDQLVEKDIIRIQENEKRSERKIYLTKYYWMELETAYHLKRLLKSENKFNWSDWKKRIKGQESKQGWKFTQEQIEGIKLGLEKQLCFITGSAGCGKSSLVSGILSVLSKYSFAQCSLSGKAAARLKEVTGQEGYTIHRLLGYQPGRGFIFNEINPLKYDIIIVDEISLIGGEIFLSLLRAIPNGTKVFILGDMGQLESIGCMNLASDLFKSVNIPTKELKTIHRQAKKSGIILSSHSIRNGEQVFSNTFEGEDVIGELQDMTFDVCPKEEVVEHIIERFEYYYEQPDFDIMNVQLISPVKDRGNSSVYILNTEIQKIVNPVLENEHNTVTIPISAEKLYKIHKNDKILCVKNCYDIETTEENVKTDIYNGWIGIVEDIEDYSQTITVYFPLIDKKVVISYEKKNILTLGYAITCHKMQGASAKIIIGSVDFSTPPMMLTKELLYTMITRAEKECIVVGQNRAIRKAIDQSGISNKKTFLLDMLDKDIATEADYEALNKAINKRKEKYLSEKVENVKF